MSQIVREGNPRAVVTGLIIQELDLQKNVVFQWRSWDHFQITDAIAINLAAPSVDYVHGNAIELDTDGCLLLSSRNMCEITKISRTTGEILWRWGGRNNEFTFVNDSLGFSYQHAIRRIPNGNVTLFDNGNLHPRPFSRALEYMLDETTKTATLVWEYSNRPPAYANAMGYVQRLPNGNTLIGWGTATPTVTEVGPDGTKVFELSFEEGVFSYRVYRYEWQTAAAVEPGILPLAVSMSQNYPNPFNGSTHLTLGLPFEATVSVSVFNVLGEEVKRILDPERRQAGTYSVELDMSGFPTGVYFCRLSLEGRSLTQRMVYLR
jgi:hypothetical protein